MPPSEQPVAIVTGAGAGIGRATALLLARSGFRVALAGRNEGPLQEVASEIAQRAGAPPCVAIHTDVGDPEQVERLIEETQRGFGRIDVLINNAGRSDHLPIDQTDLRSIRATFDVNAIGPALAIHLVWPTFMRQRTGCVVNVSSYGTDDPFPGLFAYAAAKASVNLMARSCAKEGAEFGVRAFAVAPGAVETALLRSIFDRAMLPPEACMTPEDVARVILDCVQGRRDRDNGRTIFMRRDGDQIVEFVR